MCRTVRIASNVYISRNGILSAGIWLNARGCSMTDTIIDKYADRYFAGVPRRDLAIYLAYTFFIAALGFAAGWIVNSMFF